MRLDEWQEYLASQFVTPIRAAKTPDQPLADVSSERSGEFPARREAIGDDRAGRDSLGRRVPSRRARRARTVKPEQALANVTTTELWASVPRHVRTLIELGRQAEAETAQSSYKRTFREERIELIERLLDPVLTLEETARLLNVCPTTVRRYTNRGILTYYRKQPSRSEGAASNPGYETRQRRFRLSDVLAFLESQDPAGSAGREHSPTTSLGDSERDTLSPADSEGVSIGRETDGT